MDNILKNSLKKGVQALYDAGYSYGDVFTAMFDGIPKNCTLDEIEEILDTKTEEELNHENLIDRLTAKNCELRQEGYTENERLDMLFGFNSENPNLPEDITFEEAEEILSSGIEIKEVEYNDCPSAS